MELFVNFLTEFNLITDGMSSLNPLFGNFTHFTIPSGEILSPWKGTYDIPYTLYNTVKGPLFILIRPGCPTVLCLTVYREHMLFTM